MYLLDTNIVSLLDPRRHATSPALIAWIGENGLSLFLSSVTILEMQAGILKLRRENKTQRSDELGILLEAIISDFADRVLAPDIRVMREAAVIAEAARPAVIELSDLLIAATAKAHGLTVLTRNVRHFVPTGVPFLDPTANLPPDA